MKHSKINSSFIRSLNMKLKCPSCLKNKNLRLLELSTYCLPPHGMDDYRTLQYCCTKCSITVSIASRDPEVMQYMNNLYFDREEVERQVFEAIDHLRYKHRAGSLPYCRKSKGSNRYCSSKSAKIHNQCLSQVRKIIKKIFKEKI